MSLKLYIELLQSTMEFEANRNSFDTLPERGKISIFDLGFIGN